MLLYYRTGDLFTSTAQVLVNPVNYVGVMGKGLALQFKRRFPDLYQAYRERCKAGNLRIGGLFLYAVSAPRVLKFPTKPHYRDASQLSFIEKGLDGFTRTYARWNIESIAFPRLGCGAGGLSWQEVRPVMERYLNPLEIDVYLYVWSRGDRTSNTVPITYKR